MESQVKLISVKPQQIDNIVEVGVGKCEDNLLISILAGVSIKRLIQKFPNHKCVRVVTNVPIIVGNGLTGIAWGNNISEKQKEFTKRIFENSSKIYEFNEDNLDIFWH